MQVTCYREDRVLQWRWHLTFMLANKIGSHQEVMGRKGIPLKNWMDYGSSEVPYTLLKVARATGESHKLREQ